MCVLFLNNGQIKTNSSSSSSSIRIAPIFKKIGQFAEIFRQLPIHFVFVLVLNVVLAGGGRKLHEVCENLSSSVIFTTLRLH